MSAHFRVTATDGAARTGVLETAHGPVHTPIFMPVGTKASVKAMLPAELRDLGAQIVLANAYHLHFRPGEERIAALGGLHRFSGWDGPILTDSGGFQVFSLRHTAARIDDDGVRFRSIYDGSEHRFTPELAMRVQRLLGSDIAMAFDECPPAGVEPRRASRPRCGAPACGPRRSRAQPRADGQLGFGIVQGGIDLRAAPPQRRGDRRARIRRQRRRRPLGGGGAGGDAGDAGGDRRAPAGRPAALPDGRRRPRRASSRGSPAGSTCSTACCRRGSAAPARRWSRAAGSTCATPRSRPTTARSTPAARARPAPASRRAYIRHLVTQSEISRPAPAHDPQPAPAARPGRPGPDGDRGRPPRRAPPGAHRGRARLSALRQPPRARPASHSAKVGPASVASGPGRRPPPSYTAVLGSAGSAAASTRTGVAASGDVWRRQLDEVLLARAGDLRDRRRRGRRGACGHVRQRPGHRPGRDDLRAHPGHVHDVALPAPLHELWHELVELGRAQHLRRHRAGEHQPARGPPSRRRSRRRTGRRRRSRRPRSGARRPPGRPPAGCGSRS